MFSDGDFFLGNAVGFEILFPATNVLAFCLLDPVFPDFEGYPIVLNSFCGNKFTAVFKLYFLTGYLSISFYS